MMKLSLIVSLVALSSSVVACSGRGASSSDIDPQVAASDEEALRTSGPLSQSLICAAVKAYEDAGDLSGLSGLEQSTLKGDALRDFKSWQRGMVPDYPSAAYKLPVSLGGKTYDFVLVVEMNDGGGSAGIYRKSGELVTMESGGESATLEWSAPANRCE